MKIISSPKKDVSPRSNMMFSQKSNSRKNKIQEHFQETSIENSNQNLFQKSEIHYSKTDTDDILRASTATDPTREGINRSQSRINEDRQEFVDLNQSSKDTFDVIIKQPETKKSTDSLVDLDYQKTKFMEQNDQYEMTESKN